MKKVKIFSSYEERDLENDINKFFEENNNIKGIDITYQCMRNDVGTIFYSCLIKYNQE